MTALAGLWASSGLAGHGAGGLVPSYAAEHIRRMMDAGEPVVLVDVRPVAAYRRARLPGARSIPLAELERRFGEVPRSGRVRDSVRPDFFTGAETVTVKREQNW